MFARVSQRVFAPVVARRSQLAGVAAMRSYASAAEEQECMLLFVCQPDNRLSGFVYRP
jgi:hypothetical protein